MLFLAQHIILLSTLQPVIIRFQLPQKIFLKQLLLLNMVCLVLICRLGCQMRQRRFSVLWNWLYRVYSGLLVWFILMMWLYLEALHQNIWPGLELYWSEYNRLIWNLSQTSVTCWKKRYYSWDTWSLVMQWGLVPPMLTEYLLGMLPNRQNRCDNFCVWQPITGNLSRILPK